MQSCGSDWISWKESIGLGRHYCISVGAKFLSSYLWRLPVYENCADCSMRSGMQSEQNINCISLHKLSVTLNIFLKILQLFMSESLVFLPCHHNHLCCSTVVMANFLWSLLFSTHENCFSNHFKLISVHITIQMTFFTEHSHMNFPFIRENLFKITTESCNFF